MFTVSVSASGTHLRPDHHYAHPAHSRLNLHSDNNDSSDTEDKHLSSPFIQGGNLSDSQILDIERKASEERTLDSGGTADAPEDLDTAGKQSGKKCDLKALIYLSCFAFIVISGIVLIVMAAMGHFNDSR